MRLRCIDDVLAETRRIIVVDGFGISEACTRKHKTSHEIDRSRPVNRVSSCCWWCCVPSRIGFDAIMRSFTRTTSTDLPDTPEMYCMMNFEVSVLPARRWNRTDDSDQWGTRRCRNSMLPATPTAHVSACMQRTGTGFATDDHALILAIRNHVRIRFIRLAQNKPSRAQWED
jgi:hypothetical protein